MLLPERARANMVGYGAGATLHALLMVCEPNGIHGSVSLDIGVNSVTAESARLRNLLEAY